MLSRKPLAYMQKTYDDCYLVCSTAVYFETQSNEAEALRSWKNALEQLNYHNAFRVPVGYRPKSETERALMESLRQMEAQCKERVDLLEAIKKSREEAEDTKLANNEGARISSNGYAPARLSVPGDRSRPMESVEGWLAEGTIPPTDYAQLAKPPPLPKRPSFTRYASSESEMAKGKATTPMDDAILPTLTPFASNSKNIKQSRTPSPEKRSMLRTLRPSNKERKDSSSRPASMPKAKPPVPAAKAAAQAWTPNRPSSSASAASKMPGSSGKPTRLSTSPSTANTSLPRERGRKSEPVILPYRKEYNPSSPSVDISDAIETAQRLHGNRRSRDTITPPERGSSDIERQRKGAAPVICRPESGRPRRKPVPKGEEDEPVYVNAGSSSPTHNARDEVAESETIASPEERVWKEKVTQLMKHLPKGVDEAAAKQIFNEIVVQGDEVHWDDVAGLDVAKNALKETVVYPFLRPDLFMGLREPARGMLLFGPPGTGKTMLARAVATESKSTFFAISASSLTSKFLGESEKLVRALFQLAKALAPSIVFVDEIDSLLSSRGDSGEHEATRRIKTEFLIQWSDLARAAAGREQSDREKEKGDASRVLVLAATNMPWAIDEAARRRFVRRQYIPLPEDHVRKLQIETLLSHQKHNLNERDIAKLVRLTAGFSGSDITALAKDAAMGPLRSLGEALLSMTMEEIRPISVDDFVNSLKSIRPSVSKQGLKQFEDWAREYGERGG